MAEFCLKCFLESIRVSKGERTVMSEEEDICEGCGEIRPYVDHVEDIEEREEGE